MSGLRIAPRGIGWRIFISFTALMVALTSLFSFLGLQFAQRNIYENASNELRLLSVVLSRQVQRQLARIEDSLGNLGKDEPLLAELRRAEPDELALENLLTARLEKLPHFSDLAVFNRGGACIGSTRPELYDLPMARRRAFFTNGLKGFSMSEISLPDEGRLQLVSLPVTIGGTVRGVLVGEVNLTSIYDLMDQRLGVAETTEAFLVDSEVRFITPGRRAGPGEERRLESSHLVGTPLVRHLRDEFWVGRYAGNDGIEVLGTALKVPGRDWYVVVERDIAEVVQPVDDVKKIIVLATVAIIVALVLMTYLLTRSITRPLSSLVAGTQRLAKGDFAHPIAVPEGVDEVAFLAREIDRMRARIAAFQERMIERLEVSERKRIESERLAAIGTLASTLAHEIRNPLNAMSLLLSRLDPARGAATARGGAQGDPATIRDLRGEIARLDRLVSDILDYARPVRLEYRDVDLGQFLQGAVELYRGSFDEQGVACRLTLPPRPVQLRADPDKLKQCIVNLLENALDAVAAGGRIDIAATTAEGGVEIVLADDGVGLPPESEGRIFDLFYTTKERGTGLGLSTVKKIVDAHGGEISIGRRSAAGAGTVVRLAFPNGAPFPVDSRI